MELYNETSFNKWVDLGEAPALPESLKLYKKLLSLGIKIVFITGRPLAQQDVTAKNLKTAGFHTWEKVKDIVGLACVPAKRTVPKVTHH